MHHRPAALLLRSLVLFLSSASVLSANPREARDMALAMAGAHARAGFILTSTSHAGVLGGGGQDDGQAYLIPVVKGFDYVLLVGTDQGALIVNVYDETDNAILEGRPAAKPGGVQFRAAYNGTARVHVYVARSSDKVHYHVLQMSRATAMARDLAARRAAAPGAPSLPDTVDDLRQRIASLPKMVAGNARAVLPAKLEERFQSQISELTNHGYAFTSGDHSYRCESKSYTQLLVPVTKGFSYAVVAAANSSTGPIHGYVHDEAGTFLTRDTYTNREFAIPFVATYNGTAVVYIEVTDVDSVGQINVSVGRRALPVH